MLYIYALFSILILSVLTIIRYIFSKSKIIGLLTLLIFSTFLSSGVVYKKDIQYWSYRLFHHVVKKVYPIVSQSKPKEKFCSFTKKVVPSMKKDAYKKHRKAGSMLKDVKYVKDNKSKSKLIESGVLVQLWNEDGFVIAKMNYGSPYVHKKTYEIIKEIESRFLEVIKEQDLSEMKFQIASALRTEEQQIRIRKKYPRQATKGISSHSYGASIDISAVRGRDCEIGRIYLGKILQDMQKEKRVYLTPESTTIHVTAR